MISGTLVGDSYYQRDIHDVGYQLASYAYLNLVTTLLLVNAIHIRCTNATPDCW